MFRSIILSVLAIGLPISPTLAKTVPVDRQQITANISNDLGQLFDWSPTDRRIERIFFDNPEQFHKSFIFTTDGCKKDKCTNASLLNISARPGSGDARSSIKVVLTNRLGKKYIYTINHKRIAINYFIFCLISGLAGTVLATLIRLELAVPGSFFFKHDSIRYLQVINGTTTKKIIVKP